MFQVQIVKPKINETEMTCSPCSASECFTLSLWIRSAPQMFADNFQTAKEALTAATAQAAEKAASSVRDFAQKSFRLLMDVKLKAPLIIIPQSSTSQNALMMDLGLITVKNSFSLLPAEGLSLPPVVETLDVKLTQLKVSRCDVFQGSMCEQEALKY